MRDARLWLASQHERDAQLANGPRVVPIEGNRRLQLRLRFGLPVLDAAKLPHRRVRHRPVPVQLQRFAQQFFCVLRVLANGAAETVPILPANSKAMPILASTERGSISSARSNAR